MPSNGMILEVIPLYEEKPHDPNGIRFNPQTIVLYEDVETKRIGMFELVEFCSKHQYFGFRYRKTEKYYQIRPGQYFAQGDVFLDSPNVTDDGDYCYGTEAMIAHMTHPGVSEDGGVVSESFINRIAYRTYKRRTIAWGKNTEALNTYGTPENPKKFPEIGDYIREDGLVAAIRRLDRPELAIVERSPISKMMVDHTFDRSIYAEPGGKVIDVIIHHHAHDRNIAESHSDQQANKYDDERRKFCKKIVEHYKRWKRDKGDNLVISDDLGLLVQDCYAVIAESNGFSENTARVKDDRTGRITKINHKIPMDTYHVEIVIEYVNKPNIGVKLTGRHGDKGVICRILPDEMMPVDKAGHRAEILVDPGSSIGRANPGRDYEMYFNAAAIHTEEQIYLMLDVKKKMGREEAFEYLFRLGEARWKAAYDYLMGYYALGCPELIKLLEASPYPIEDNDKLIYLTEVIEKGVGNFKPPHQDMPNQDGVVAIENSIYRPLYDTVSFIGELGQRVETVDKVRISSRYILVLEKVADDGAAVASANTQHDGIPSPQSKDNRYTSPVKRQPLRGGEAEFRNFLANCGVEFSAEMIDRNNNPTTHEAMCYETLTADMPSNVENMVDRAKIPFGGAKPSQLIRHLMMVGGVKFRYQPFVSGAQEQVYDIDYEEIQDGDD
jgi:DNA-directed RNA polymerase beta subunit